MHRPGAAVAVRVRFIAGKTHAGISVYCAPDTVDLHIQLTAYHHHMFDHPGFVRRGLAQRAGRQGDGEMVELKLFIPGKAVSPPSPAAADRTPPAVRFLE